MEWFLIFFLKNQLQSYIIVWNQTFGSILYLKKTLSTEQILNTYTQWTFDNLFII